MSWTEDVREGLRGLDGSPRALRRFAGLVGAVLLALAAWLAWRGRAPALAVGLAAAGGLLWLVGLLAPASLRPVHRAWMTVALALGWLTSRLVLTLLFFLVVTPVGLLARLVGRRFLERHPDPGAASYWQKRPPERRVDYTRLH